MSDQLFYNGRITTMDPACPDAEAVGIRDGRFVAVGTEKEVRARMGRKLAVVDLLGRRVLPGLHDGHIHFIRGGLTYAQELRWDGLTSLSDAMAMLREQVTHTPPPQWVRVAGGFSLSQFAEKRLPTLEELNAIAPDTPVLILHLYDRALLNRAALRAVGYDRETPNPPGGEIVRDRRGEPTGLLLANPDPGLLYAALARGPKLSLDAQATSTLLFMRELNRLGVTAIIDAGGGFQNYPEDYVVIEKLAREGLLTVRIAYNLFTQHPGGELTEFTSWTRNMTPGQGDEKYRLNGAGEMLVFSAADFGNFRQPRPELPPGMEGELERVVRVLVEHRWPFRMHATYDETITRALDAFEKVDHEIPFAGLHWFFDHAETISERSIDRVRALGGGIAIQHRMAYQGEFFIERYGRRAASATPPIRRMLDAGIPVGGGTDATRVASYNPWVCLHWLITGRTVGGVTLYPRENVLDRHEALRLWTSANAWFANGSDGNGMIREGEAADFMVPSADYFAVDEDDIRFLSSHLTVVDGNPVYAAGDFAHLAPPAPKAAPDWSPVARHGGYHIAKDMAEAYREGLAVCQCSCGCGAPHHHLANGWVQRLTGAGDSPWWGSLSCGCWL